MKRIMLSIAMAVILIFPVWSSDASSYPPPANIRVTTIPQLNNEEQVWICPTDSNIIIANWRDFRLGYRQVGIGRSTDGGLTWGDSLISQSMQVSFTDSWQSDPTLTVDRLGNFYISVLDFSNPSAIDYFSYIAFYKSIDKGVSWTGPVLHLPSVDVDVFEDKQFITVDRTGGVYDGNLYCTWARFPNTDGNRMAFIRSIDGGTSFEDTLIIGPTQSSTGCGTGISSGQFPIPVVSSNGDVHVFWMGYALDSGAFCSAEWTIKHVVSTDGGQSFDAGDVILPVTGWYSASNGTDIYSNPAADADISGGPFDGNIYIAFTNTGDEDVIRADVDFIYSTDNGATWTERVQLNDDVTAPVSDSYHPWLIVNEEGVVIVIFYDTRFDPPFHQKFDLMATYSFDGGQTLTSNHRISSVSSDAGNLKSESQPQELFDADGRPIVPVLTSRAGLIGEYIGVTAFYDKVNAVWTDSRHGNSEVYTANWYLPMLEPRLIAPVDSGYTNANPTLSWSTSWKHNLDRYRLEIADDAGFTTNLQSHVIDTTFFTPIAGLAEGLHYWRVKTFNTAGTDSSEYSATRLFEVDTTPPASAELFSPADASITLNPMPTFDWSDVTKAGAPVVYDLYLSTDSTFPAGPLTSTYFSIAVSQYTPVDSLTENAFTFWKVIARDQAGNSSNSDVWSVKYIQFLCGDINNDGTAFNIVDLNFLVNYIFRGGPLPPIIPASDLNGSGGNPNIVDLNIIVNRIFRGAPLPTCQP